MSATRARLLATALSLSALLPAAACAHAETRAAETRTAATSAAETASATVLGAAASAQRENADTESGKIGAATATPDTQAPNTQAPQRPPFNEWRAAFRSKALAQNISAEVFDAALGNVQPVERVMELDAHQPEFSRPIWDYLDSAVSDSRIANGRERLRENAALFDRMERQYGVDRHYLTAIWGLESAYGAITGGFNVFEALATLAWHGRRQNFAENQLIAALKIVQSGDKNAQAMTGSWAGAMGHTQFIPTSYLTYAKDGDGDGKRDIWDSLPDVFASTAAHLADEGWVSGYRWGREVRLPQGFDYSQTGYDVKKPLADWAALGLTTAAGGALPVADLEASVLVPAGHQGPAFLIYENFRSILGYNYSTSYALAVGLLAQRLAGGPGIQASWPRDDRPLTRDERMEVQSVLNRLGYDAGEVDGILGGQTRRALAAFQAETGLVPDGYASAGILDRLRAAAS